MSQTTVDQPEVSKGHGPPIPRGCPSKNTGRGGARHPPRAAAALLSLLLALPGGVARGEDGGVDAPLAYESLAAVVSLPDGGAVRVSGGCWLADERCIGVAKELRRLNAENAELKKAPPVSPLVALVLGLLVGGAVGAGVAIAAGK